MATNGEPKAGEGTEAAAEPPAEKPAEDGEPAEPEGPKELEEDAPKDDRPPLPAGAVTFLTQDTTLNVMPALDGEVLMALSDGGFQYLLAGARASAGMKAGRYMFEVMICEGRNPQEPQGAKSAGPRPRQLVRVGLSASDTSLFLADGADNVCFDSEGSFIHGAKRQKISEKFGPSEVVAVLVNLDDASPNANTVSLFKDGVRACPPQPIPEQLKGKALFPAVTYRNVTLRVNFGPTRLRPLPFECTLLGQAAEADCEVKAAVEPPDGVYEVVFPVGLPDEGTFDWVDQFLAEHSGYTELSDRAILTWAAKSGLQRQGGYNKRSCNDKPEPGFGLPPLDEYGLQKVMSSVAPALPRNFIVMEVKGNLLSEQRKAVLKKFPGPKFRKKAQVLMGEPPALFKSWVKDLMLADKKEVARKKVLVKKAELARKKAEEEKKRKAEEERKKKLLVSKKAMEKKEAAEKGESKEAEPSDKPVDEGPDKMEEEEEEVKVSLTDEEEKLWFRKKEVSDLTEKDLAANYDKFTLPSSEEGFDEVCFQWEPEEKSKEYMKQWMSERKLTQRVEDLQPSEWFKAKWAEWSKLLKSWQKKQQDFKDPVKKKAAAEAAKKKAADGDGGEESKEINSEDLDVFVVEDVMDIGNGEPLFAHFQYEDWILLSTRFELCLLVHAFRRDLDDPERPTFHESHLGFYYNKYFKKTFSLKTFGVGAFADLVDMIKDTVEINPKNATLESALSDDTPMDNFVKLTEDHRRDRLRRLDAGDETAELKFAKPLPSGQVPRAAGGPSTPSAAGARGSYGGKGGSDAGTKRAYPGGGASSAYPPPKQARPPYGGGSGGAGGYGSYGGGSAYGGRPGYGAGPGGYGAYRR